MPVVTFHCPVCGADIDYNLANLPDPTQRPINFASTEYQTIIPAPPVGKRLRITSMFLSVELGQNIEIEMFSNYTSIGIFSGNAYSDDWSPALVLGENEAFVMKASMAYEVFGQVCYYEEGI